jgi:hypothetical protein
MAHFAQLDENNVVLQVIVVHNNELVESKDTVVNEDGSVSVSVVESEAKGIAFCQSLFGADTRWVQTSYNNSFRGNYAGVGNVYDAENNVFVGPIVEEVAPVVEEAAQVTSEVSVLSSADIPVLSSADVPAMTSADIPALSSADVAPLTSADVAPLTSADIPALTTSDISSLG